MKIKVEEAIRISDKYGPDEVPLIFLEDFFLRTNTTVLELTHGMRFDPSQYELFLNAGVKEIEVQFSERLLAKMVTNFPAAYKLPTGKKNIVELDRIIDTIDAVNNSSKRKRSVISLTEVYKSGANGVNTPVLRYGEKLDHKRWNEIKVGLSRTNMIDFRYDECGIIVFFLLNAGDQSYAQKFMKFTELVSLVLESKRSGISISSDFNPECDVYTVNEKTKLLEVYNDTRASMVIIGEDINEDYKMSLTQLKLFDKYAKMMVIKNIEPTQHTDILNKIKAVYSQNLWEE